MQLNTLLIIAILYIPNLDIAGQTISQNLPFEFSHGERPYEFLQNPVSINNNKIWDHQLWEVIDLGFSFELFDQQYDKIEVRSGGVDFFEEGGSRSKRIFSFYKLLQDRGSSTSASPVAYEYAYSEEFQEFIFKIEWRNAGIISSESKKANPDDYINVQVWLHQTTSKINIHFGPSQLAPDTYLNNLNEAGPLGLKLLMDGYFVGPIGHADEPELLNTNKDFNKYPNIETYPKDGKFYCFELNK